MIGRYSVATIFIISAIIFVGAAPAEEGLYSKSSRGMGIIQFDITVTEVKREPQISKLAIPGFRDRSAAAARWIMCAYTDLAIKRGFKYWAALEESSDTVQLGFTNSEDEDLRKLGPQFSKERVMVSSVATFASFCGISTLSSEEQKQKASVIPALRDAAEKGNAKSQLELADAYLRGQGVPQDNAEAVKWTRKAAEQGYAPAQFGLGTIYWNGRVVKQDIAEALKWYHAAAEQDDAGAQRWLGWIYFDGASRVTPDYAEALRWTQRAAEQGVAVAQSLMGRIYNEGKGVPQDYVQAYMWFKLSEAVSQPYLAQVTSRMTPQQIEEAQRLVTDWKLKPKRLK